MTKPIMLDISMFVLALQESKPKVYQAFNDGQFSVQLSCHNNRFRRIPVNQATEVNMNKDTQDSRMYHRI